MSNKENNVVLVTGNTGYIGTVMTEFLQEHSYKVVGLDYNYYEGCNFYPSNIRPYKQITKDIRDVSKEDLDETSAVIHLAALSNDPLGEINPSLTHKINCTSSVKLAKLAKSQGIKKFLFASSCSIYGVAPYDKPLPEEAPSTPVTAYAKAKSNAEKGILKLADEDFHPVYMRSATVYGVSPSLRLDLVVNNLVARSYLTGKVTILSDGTPWRPIIHVKDFCQAFLAVLESSEEKISNETFNVGRNEENYRVLDIAKRVKEIVPNSQVEILNKSEADERTYRVDFTKIKTTVPLFKPSWNLSKGIEELYKAYKKYGLTQKDLESPKYFRVRWIRHLIESKKLDQDLKWM